MPKAKVARNRRVRVKVKGVGEFVFITERKTDIYKLVRSHAAVAKNSRKLLRFCLENPQLVGLGGVVEEEGKVKAKT